MPQLNNCDFCRNRKLRCSKEKPCSSCLRLGKRCVYTPRPKRVPLTRQYVQQLHQRIQELEALVNNGKNPLSKVSPEDKTQLKRSTDPCKPPNGSLSPSHLASRRILSDISPNPYEVVKCEDMVPYDDVEALDWSEGDPTSGEETSPRPNPKKKALVDGMGALTVGQSGDSHSYYGVTSSHGILKFLTNYKADGNEPPSSSLPYISAFANPNNEKLLQSDKVELILDNRRHRDDFFNSYFETYHTCFPFLNEHSIRAAYAQTYGKPIESSKMSFKDKIFQILLNAILAVGCLMKLGERSVIDLLYYKRVKFWIQKVNIMESCNYQLLETLVLLGNYVQKRNKPNTAWNYHGIAIRMAITFGLHKDIRVDPSKPTDATLVENLERRRRLWWCLFYFDIGHSITFGRPAHTLRLESIDIRLPSNVDDVDLIGAQGSLEDYIKPYPTIHDSLIQEAKLAKIAYVVLNQVTSSRATPSSDGFVNNLKGYLEINELIVGFCNDVPLYFVEDDEKAAANLQAVCPTEWYELTLNGELKTPKWFPISRRKVIWRYKNIQLLMFRSFIWEIPSRDLNDGEAKDLEKAVQICYDASCYIIRSVYSFVMNEVLDTHSSWYCTYFLFQATLIPVLLWIRSIKTSSSTKVDTRDLMQSIDLAQTALGQLQEHNLLAPKLLETVKTLMSPLTGTVSENDNSLLELSSATINLFSNIQMDFKVDLSPSEYFSSIMNPETSIPDTALQALEDELFPHENWGNISI